MDIVTAARSLFCVGNYHHNSSQTKQGDTKNAAVTNMQSIFHLYIGSWYDEIILFFSLKLTAIFFYYFF